LFDFVGVWRTVWHGTARKGDAGHRLRDVTPPKAAKIKPFGPGYLLSGKTVLGKRNRLQKKCRRSKPGGIKFPERE
jgi:hypothetical protein